MIIELVIRGTPRLFIKWYKDCRELKNDDKYIQTRDGEINRLSVHNPTFRDSGTYMLLVENAFGVENIKYEIDFKKEEEHVACHGVVYHADLSKTTKFQKEEERKKQERLAYRPPPLPKPEPVVEVVPEPEPVVEEEEESEYETDISEYDEDGERIEHEPVKKVKKLPTPPPKEPTPPPKEPTPPPKEPTPPPKLPTPPPKEKTPEVVKEKTPEPVVVEDPTVPGKKPEIEKPITIFRAHRIRNFRENAEVPLEIVKRLINQMIKKGNPMKLSCCVSEGDARIKAFWYRDEEPVEYDPIAGPVANATEDGLVTLEFKKVDLSDAGRYKVVVKTKKGEISSQCDVNVYGDIETPIDDCPPTLCINITGKFLHINVID